MRPTVMTMNAVRAYAEDKGFWRPADDEEWTKGPSKQVVASIPYLRLKDAYNIGKLGLADVVQWLAEDGLAMPGTPDGAKVKQVSQSRLDAAADLLRRHGYKVDAPN